MNPLKMMQLSSAMKKFQGNHPRFIAFWNAVRARGLHEGTVLELKMTAPEGETLVTNIRVTREDLELLRELQELASSASQ